MHFNDKSACLSRHALTSHHGRLLQDSGFTKLDTDQTSSRDWARTTMNQLAELSCQSVMQTATLRSGKHAILNSPKADPSISAQTLPEILSTLRSAMDKLSSAKTSCPHSNWGCPGPRGIVSWVLNLASTLCPICWAKGVLKWPLGSTPTGRVTRPEPRRLLSSHSLGLLPPTYDLAKILSIIRYQKSEVS